jgi:hypothetical protein
VWISGESEGGWKSLPGSFGLPKKKEDATGEFGLEPTLERFFNKLGLERRTGPRKGQDEYARVDIVNVLLALVGLVAVGLAAVSCGVSGSSMEITETASLVGIAIFIF